MKGVKNFYNNIFSGCNIREVKRSSTNVHFFYKNNTPFYRYGGHIEFIRFKEHYGMHRGHSLSNRELKQHRF